MNKRLKQEIETKNIMIGIYCRANHHPDNALCQECQDLMEYSDEQVENCIFGDNKPVCSNCTVHCYSATYRHQIQKIMRFSGPRMIWHHPILTIRHLINSKKHYK